MCLTSIENNGDEQVKYFTSSCCPTLFQPSSVESGGGTENQKSESKVAML